MTKSFNPAISVVIPMYNVEKYIGECLESVLAQTFQDFEIIVVDNCSTDNSCAVVESYVKKFGEKIKLIRKNFNSGGGGQSRSDGLRYSRGKYLFFMDSDDVMLNNSLEELYNLAEDFQADVVHCQNHFQIKDDSENVSTDEKFLKIIPSGKIEQVDEPKFMTNNLAERIKLFSEEKLGWAPWLNLINRDLIAKFDLKFLQMRISDDFIFFFFLLCSAEKFLLQSKPLYVYRVHQASMMHKGMNLNEIIHYRIGEFFLGMKNIDDFMKKFDFFEENPDYKYKVFDLFAANAGLTSAVLRLYSNIPAPVVDKMIREELKNFDDTSAAVAFLFSRMSILTINFIRQQNLINQLQIENLKEQ